MKLRSGLFELAHARARLAFSADAGKERRLFLWMARPPSAFERASLALRELREEPAFFFSASRLTMVVEKSLLSSASMSISIVR
ncbi:MAG: hypothetical protein HS130_03070 [Deltaproteobacteria bacterium]|nr:hypothetical protein [Deltaproteobacteria bacterium]